MMLYDMSVQHQAERIKTAAEQRRADEQLGMMAAEVSRLWRRVTRPPAPAWPPREARRVRQVKQSAVTETSEAMPPP